MLLYNENSIIARQYERLFNQMGSEASENVSNSKVGQQIKPDPEEDEDDDDEDSEENK